jgi:hypothetical protein
MCQGAVPASCVSALQNLQCGQTVVNPAVERPNALSNKAVMDKDAILKFRK